MRQVKRELLDLQLPLKEIDWVFEGGVCDAVHWNSVPIDAHRCLCHLLVELIDDLVDFLFEGLEAVLVFGFKVCCFVVYEVLHVFGVLEV